MEKSHYEGAKRKNNEEDDIWWKRLSVVDNPRSATKHLKNILIDITTKRVIIKL